LPTGLPMSAPALVPWQKKVFMAWRSSSCITWSVRLKTASLVGLFIFPTPNYLWHAVHTLYLLDPTCRSIPKSIVFLHRLGSDFRSSYFDMIFMSFLVGYQRFGDRSTARPGHV
jgi:hypothetical protein